MSLLVGIAQLVLVVTLLRALFRMVLPPNKPPAPRPREEAPGRFDGTECDISDADYEDVTRNIDP